MGTNPKTARTGVRRTLDQYGKILDCQKKFISKKLPGWHLGRLKAGVLFTLTVYVSQEEKKVSWRPNKEKA